MKSLWILINGSYNCCIGIESGEAKELILLKSSSSKECTICQYWFCNQGFQFQNVVCNGGHNLTAFCLHLSNAAIITVKGVDYCCIIYDLMKYEASHLLENYLLDNRGYL